MKMAFVGTSSSSITVRVLTGPSFGTSNSLFNAAWLSGAAFSTSCDVSSSGQLVKVQYYVSSFSTTYVLNAGDGSSVASSGFPDASKDPISFTSGAFTHDKTDLALSGRGVPLEFTRSYSSATATLGRDLGFGWTHNYSSYLSIYSDGSVEAHEPDGSDVFFSNSSGAFAAPRGIFDTMVRNVDGSYTLTKPSQLRMNFDSSGRLSSLSDRNGNTTTVSYNENGISAITDANGRALTVTADAATKRITQVTDPIGRSVSYHYNSSGDLDQVTDASGGVTTFTYANHRLLTITDARGNIQVTNSYDSAGRVAEQGAAMAGANVTYGANTLTDTTQSFTTNALAGLTVISGGTSGTVASNTATTVTLSANWSGGAPAAGALYWVVGDIAASGAGGGVTYQSALPQLTDTSQSFGTLAGNIVVAGGSTGTVASNTATAITLSAPGWTDALPAAGAKYWIAAGGS
ncbi:MAG: RHS repeat protein [Chloroflexi bacterium]|nr:RHS repeat protein [Chloroflexota bacterium]